jgi:hypothetical protein
MRGRKVRNEQDARDKLAQMFAHLHPYRETHWRGVQDAVGRLDPNTNAPPEGEASWRFGAAQSG